MGENCSIIFVYFEQNLPKKPILPKKTHFTQKNPFYPIKPMKIVCVIIPMRVFYPKQPL